MMKLIFAKVVMDILSPPAIADKRDESISHANNENRPEHININITINNNNAVPQHYTQSAINSTSTPSKAISHTNIVKDIIDAEIIENTKRIVGKKAKMLISNEQRLISY